MRKIVYFIEYILIKILFFIFKLIGYKISSNLGFIIGVVFGSLFNFKKYICKNQIKKGRSSVRDLLTLFKNGSSIALMIDQRVSEGLKLDFFQEKAYTTTIPAQFVKKFNCKIVPIHIDREKEVNFRLTIFKPLKFNENDSLKKITQDLNFWLENTIKGNPKKWIWSHDRWK